MRQFNTEEELTAYGVALAAQLTSAHVVTLTGTLGVGKTVLARGICLGLGVSISEVSSPSYALIHHYQGRIPVVHIDLYRLTQIEEFELIGGFDLLHRVLTIIEWPALIEDQLFTPRVDITLNLGVNGVREVETVWSS
jgi:tRNA threonylcarbamoyladenosine biosynthesis protein TsaE